MTHNFIILAYLDPNTGSTIVQVVLASLFTIIIAIRVFWQKIKSIFHKETTNITSEAENDKK